MTPRATEMTRLQIESTPISGLLVVSHTWVSDERGSLGRLYDFDSLQQVLADREIKQVNRTRTRLAATVRGLHLQLPPNEEVKIVTCLNGRVFDVAVDLRDSSPTFLQWFGLELTETNQKSLLIPPGCAHGVQTLEMDCEVLYFHTSSFAPESESGLHPLSPLIDIKWPLPVSTLSRRDLTAPSEPDLFKGVIW